MEFILKKLLTVKRQGISNFLFLFLIPQLGWCNSGVRSESRVRLLTGVYLAYRSDFMIQEAFTVYAFTQAESGTFS